MPLAAWAADEHVVVPAHGRIEMRLPLTAADFQPDLDVWVQADPNQVQVTLIDPQGKWWTQADAHGDDPIQVELADGNSPSSDEVALAHLMGSDGTVIFFSSNVVGNYRIELSGSNLSAPAEVAVRRTTFDEIIQDSQRREEQQLASRFPAPEEGTALGAKGRGTAIVASQRWDTEDEGTAVTEARTNRLGGD